MFQFPIGTADTSNYFSLHTRARMVEVIRPVELSRHLHKDQCWWDDVRVVCGSPFLPGAMSKFEVERAKVVRPQRLKREMAEKELKRAETAETNETAETAGMD